jgi:RNA polymerase sigma-70 factor (ECF subfamily)
MAEPHLEPPEDDYVLLGRIRTGDAAALGVLYDRHGPVAYTLAKALTGSGATAEEIVCDAFAQVWQSSATFDVQRGSPVAWLLTITRSRALDWRRKHNRQTHLLEKAASAAPDGWALPVSSPGDAPDRSAEKMETRRLVRSSLDELPEAQRRVIELAYFGGLTQTEIAAELDQPLGTVKTRMRSGMSKLRDSLRFLFAPPEP